MSLDNLRGINEFLAEMIFEGKLSPELANDVLFGRLDLEEAQAIYYYENMIAEGY